MALQGRSILACGASDKTQEYVVRRSMLGARHRSVIARGSRGNLTIVILRLDRRIGAILPPPMVAFGRTPLYPDMFYLFSRFLLTQKGVLKFHDLYFYVGFFV